MEEERFWGPECVISNLGFILKAERGRGKMCLQQAVTKNHEVGA